MTTLLAPDLAIYTAPKIDCHCHALDPQRFAYTADSAYKPAGQETGSAAYFTQVLAAYGVQHALLVGPNSGYGIDNRCLLDAIATGNGRFKGIAVVSNDASTGYLQELKAQGIVGVAFNFALHGIDYYRPAEALFGRLEALGMFVQVQVEQAQLDALAPVLLGSGARLLVDHCGRPDLGAGIGGTGFTALLGLADSQRTTVKLSGFAKFSKQHFPFQDTRAYSNALLQAFGPDHCVWASDWPFLRAHRRLDYGPLLQLFAHMVSNPQDQQKILWDTPKRLFGFA